MGFTKQDGCIEYYIARYPRICANIMCEALGPITPTRAAALLKQAKEWHESDEDWILSLFGGDPRPAVSNAIQTRDAHRCYGILNAAYAEVRRYLKTGREDLFERYF